MNLKLEFPEFDIQALAKKIKNSDIRVVESEKLIDKDGVSRTCLNYPDSSLIECKSSEIEALLDHPSTLFVLVLHEYLGLIGVEETSASHANIVDGYSISRRIAKYVSKVSDYDLALKNVCYGVVKAKALSLNLINDLVKEFNTSDKEIFFTEEQIFSNSIIATREDLLQAIDSSLMFNKFLITLSKEGVMGVNQRSTFKNILSFNIQINIKEGNLNSNSCK